MPLRCVTPTECRYDTTMGPSTSLPPSISSDSLCGNVKRIESPCPTSMTDMVRFAPVGCVAGGISTGGFGVRVDPVVDVLVMHPAATTVAARMPTSNPHQLLLAVLI